MYWKREPEKNKGSHLYIDIFGKPDLIEPHEDRKKSLDSLQICVDHLNRKSKFKSWISAGTALVIHRDVSRGGEFLPHPKSHHDIDICVHEKISLRECHELLPDFRIWNIRGTEDDVWNVHLCDPVNSILTAFWFYKSNKDSLFLNYYDCGMKSQNVSFDFFYDKKLLDDIQYTEFESYSFPFLGNPDEYCENRYGPAWNIPKDTMGPDPRHGALNVRNYRKCL